MNLLNYVPGNSFLHRLNPITKLLGAFFYGAACITCTSVIGQLFLIALILVLAGVCGVGKRGLQLVKMLLILGLFMFLVQMIFVRSGDALLVVAGHTIFTTGGLNSACLMSLRIIATMLPLMILFALTQMNDLCNALVKRFHVPYRYAFIVTTAFRFVPLFTEEYHAIEEAQKARGVEYDTKNIIKKIKLVVPLFVPLLVSSIKKVDSSASSAEVRGFHLRTVKSGYKNYPFRAADAIAAIILILLLVGSILFLKPQYLLF